MRTRSLKLRLGLVALLIAIGLAIYWILPRTGDSDARPLAARIDIQNVGVALRMYRSDVGNYPSTLVELFTNRSGATDWNGPYIAIFTSGGAPSDMHPDPWGNEYIYAIQGTNFVLRSLGPDEVTSDDDIE
jgi:type II secretory pathway pseudopilin PulG